jgi:hypothetical protein
MKNNTQLLKIFILFTLLVESRFRFHRVGASQIRVKTKKPACAKTKTDKTDA